MASRANRYEARRRHQSGLFSWREGTNHSASRQVVGVAIPGWRRYKIKSESLFRAATRAGTRAISRRLHFKTRPPTYTYIYKTHCRGVFWRTGHGGQCSLGVLLSAGYNHGSLASTVCHCLRRERDRPESHGLYSNFACCVSRFIGNKGKCGRPTDRYPIKCVCQFCHGPRLGPTAAPPPGAEVRRRGDYYFTLFTSPQNVEHDAIKPMDGRSHEAGGNA
jgi:hypothetical protein